MNEEDVKEIKPKKQSNKVLFILLGLDAIALLLWAVSWYFTR